MLVAPDWVLIPKNRVKIADIIVNMLDFIRLSPGNKVGKIDISFPYNVFNKYASLRRDPRYTRDDDRQIASLDGDIMHLPVFSDDEIKVKLSLSDAIASQREAFLAIHRKEVQIPQRTIVKTHQGAVLFKPFVSEQDFGLKVVAAYSSGTPGVILLLDTQTGLPRALFCATYLTALRTAAGSAVAADILGGKEASTATIFGAGLQAELHILCLRVVRPSIKRFFVINRRYERAQILAGKLSNVWAKERTDAKACVEQSDIIVTATPSQEPLFDGSWIKPGTFIAAIGSYTRQMRELDSYTVQHAKIIADTPDEAYETSGDLWGVIERDAILMSLGELLDDSERKLELFKPEDVRLFKSIGNAVQDLYIARAVMLA